MSVVEAPVIRAPRGKQLQCKGWQQEAALRCLMKSLDPEVAERPADLVVYVGTQGILQGTFQTFAALAQRHFAGSGGTGSLAGRLVVTGGMGGMGGAQPLAVTLNGGVLLAVDVDRSRIQRRVDTRYCDMLT